MLVFGGVQLYDYRYDDAILDRIVHNARLSLRTDNPAEVKVRLAQVDAYLEKLALTAVR